MSLHSALPQRHGRKNVLFIGNDDQNTTLGCYGYPVHTPNLDALAARGTRFDRNYCQFPWCGPSRASLMTGMAPDTTKVWDLNTHFRKALPNVVTIGELFRKNGYRSVRVGKIYHQSVPEGIGESGPDDPQTWDTVFNPAGVDRTKEEPEVQFYQPHPPTNRKGDVHLGSAIGYHESEAPDEAMTDSLSADEVIRQLQKLGDKPFFLAYGLYRPHVPWIVPKKYFDMYPIETIKARPASEAENRVAPAPAYTSGPNLGMNEMQQRLAIRAYRASTTFMDAQVGRVLAELKRLKLEDSTIVVYWADHGWSLGEHGNWQKENLFESATRVPLLFAGPGTGAKGKTVTRPCRAPGHLPHARRAVRTERHADEPARHKPRTAPAGHEGHVGSRLCQPGQAQYRGWILLPHRPLPLHHVDGAAGRRRALRLSEGPRRAREPRQGSFHGSDKSRVEKSLARSHQVSRSSPSKSVSAKSKRPLFGEWPLFLRLESLVSAMRIAAAGFCNVFLIGHRAQIAHRLGVLMAVHVRVRVFGVGRLIAGRMAIGVAHGFERRGFRGGLLGHVLLLLAALGKMASPVRALARTSASEKTMKTQKKSVKREEGVAFDQRMHVLQQAQRTKMAESAHRYVRGSTVKFYEWLNQRGAHSLPEGPAVWICGDCHMGNLGPVADAAGKVDIQIRDLDQTVVGNPVHDIVRLALSLASAARGNDLPGVTTAHMLEHMMEGYQRALQRPIATATHDATGDDLRPIQRALQQSVKREWRHLAEERIQGIEPVIPLGKRFWKLSEEERAASTPSSPTRARSP